MSFLSTSVQLLSLAPLAALASAIPETQPIKQRAYPAIEGSWGELIDLPLIPVAAYVVPAFPESTKVMMWSSWGNSTFGGPGGVTQFTTFDYTTGNATHRRVSESDHDMFCPGISALADGRIIISGGSDAAKTTLYNPLTDVFAAGPEMVQPRGYQSSATLSDGRVFTIGGAYSGGREGKDGEVFDPLTNKWTALPGAAVKPMLTDDHEGIYRQDNHAWLVSWKNESIFQAGPSRNQNWYGISGEGTQVAAGERDDHDAMCGMFVMYEPGKILSMGGAPDYTDSNATIRTHITTIDTPDEEVKVHRVSNMVFPRAFGNAVVLPDGKTVVTGGQERAKVFSDTASVLAAEIFDPATNNWTTGAAAALGRNYHSVSILLPDGTVFSGGGGMCWVEAGKDGEQVLSDKCDRAVDHPNGQIYSPPYLYNADGSAAMRSNITSLPQTVFTPGGVLTAEVNAEDASLVLVRIGSVTHSTNTDQRRIPLTTTVVDSEARDGTYLAVHTTTLEADRGILIPGYYYLFAVVNGVPSIAKTVQIVL